MDYLAWTTAATNGSVKLNHGDTETRRKQEDDATKTRNVAVWPAELSEDMTCSSGPQMTLIHTDVYLDCPILR